MPIMYCGCNKYGCDDCKQYIIEQYTCKHGLDIDNYCEECRNENRTMIYKTADLIRNKALVLYVAEDDFTTALISNAVGYQVEPMTQVLIDQWSDNIAVYIKVNDNQWRKVC